MEEEYKRAQMVEREKDKQRWEESVRYQNELEKQLMEKEKKKQEAYEEFLKEKLMIDEIVRKIYEEDQRLVIKKVNWTFFLHTFFPDVLQAVRLILIDPDVLCDQLRIS